MVHRILNCSTHETEWAVWDVAMLTRPGLVFIPRSPTSKYEGGVKAFAEEGESLVVRDRVISEIGGLVAVHCREPIAFKFGTDSAEGWIMAVLESEDRRIGYRKKVRAYPGRAYGHGCVCESLQLEQISILGDGNSRSRCAPAARRKF